MANGWAHFDRYAAVDDRRGTGVRAAGAARGTAGGRATPAPREAASGACRAATAPACRRPACAGTGSRRAAAGSQTVSRRARAPARCLLVNQTAAFFRRAACAALFVVGADARAPTKGRAGAFADSRSPAGSTSSVTISTTPNNVRIARCEPGLSGGFPQANLIGLASTWMQGVTSSMSCSVRAGGSTTTQTVAFSFASGQATLGARVITLSAPRVADAISALDLVLLPNNDAVFSFNAAFADNSNLSLTRWVVNPALSVTYIAANGDTFSCTGTRQ